MTKHLPGPLVLLALGVFLGSAAYAQDEQLVWNGEVFEDGATLVLGLPNSGYAPLAFHCEAGSGTIDMVLEHEPIVATEGVEVTVLLQAGDIEVPVETRGARLEMDDLFVLQGSTPFDERFIDLITSRGTLFVFVEDGAVEFPLEGAREAALPLVATCSAG